MRLLLFLGFLALSVLVPVGLAQAETPTGIEYKHEPVGQYGSCVRLVALVECRKITYNVFRLFGMPNSS